MANQPIVTETASHVPLVNITTPTAGGVSRNLYTMFNVPQSGAILNNATAMTNTKLAGWINKNPFLLGGAAKIIVNEITSANPTHINGFLEVAGNKASVVIANPNGIMVNGGGFINTANALLTTGRPEYDHIGNLQDIRVEKGTVAVDGAGLNGREADSVSIYTRAAEINAGLWANYLNITTGANIINTKTGTINLTEAKSEQPQVAWDVSAVGGMYAGVIELIGTEKGLGVNNAGTIGATKAISLDADGTLRTSGDIYSEGTARLYATEIINHEGGRITGGDMVLSSQSVRNERNAELEAALQKEQAKLKEKENALEAAYAEDVTGFRNNAQITAYENNIKAAALAYDNQLEKVKAAQSELNEHKAGTIKAASSLNIAAESMRNTSGAVMQSAGDIGIQAGTVLNRGALLEAKENIIIKADTVQNENEAFSMKRVSTALVRNPRRIRIDEAGHSERGKVFDASEFRDLDSGYGAYHNGNAGKIDDLTFIESSSQTSWETVAINTPAKLAAGKNITIGGNTINENSWLTAGDTITAIGNLQNIAAENQARTVTFGTTQGSYTYRLSWPHKAKVRGYGDVLFMTPQIELGEPQGIEMPEVTAKRTLSNEALNPFNTASVTAHYRYETDSKYTDKREFLSSDYMDNERLYDPQIVAMQMDAAFEGRKLNGLTGSISAQNIVVDGDEIENEATIAADSIKLQGRTIQNRGIITGGKLQLDAKGNLTSTGKISGAERVSLSGQNVNIESTTAKYRNQDVVNRIAGVAVTDKNGQLAITAADTVNIAGAAIKSEGTASITAGRDVNLSTKKLHSQKDMTADGDNYLRTSRDTEMNTEIQAQGNLTVSAGQDVNAKAVFMGSQNGGIAIRAGNNINLQAGKEASHDKYSLKHTESGLLSSTTTLTRTDDEHETILGTGLSGQNITLAAGNAIHTEAAQIAADNNVDMSAKEITLNSAAQYDRDQNEKQVEESGLLANGFGILLGTRETKDTASDKYLTQQGTAIGAGGSVTVQGSDHVQITSSEIVANKGIEISAPTVTVNGKENVHESVIRHEESQTGLTVGLGGSTVSVIESVAQPLKRAASVKDDRLKALYAWRAGRNARENREALQNIGKGKLDIGLNVGIGTSHSESQTVTTEREYAGSNIAAQKDVNLQATENNLVITGSKVTGKNINLEAKEDIVLQAGQNTIHTDVTENSSSAGISAGYSFGAGFGGIGVSHNSSGLNGQGDAITYQGTNIKASDVLTTKSGKDTEISGSTASGNRVNMTVGGNLHIETLQDVDHYHETSHSSGFSIDMTKGLRPDFGISASRGNMDSDYASTTKQAGIYAGKEGFNIRTEDNTHLKGAVIASEAEADKNKISTGSLSWEDIENKAEYDAKSIGFDYHKYGDFAQKSKQSQDELYKTKGLTPNLGMPAHGDDKNTTHAAIASGNIEIRNGQQDIRGLSRDTQNALSTLGKIFDKSTIEEQQELAKVFGEEAYRLAHNMKDDGSARKIAVHAAIGGIMSQITGSGFTSGAIGAGVNEAVIKEISKIKDPGTAQIVSGIVGAAVAKVAGGNAGAGAVAAASGTRNNNFLIDKAKSIIEEESQEILNGVKNEAIYLVRNGFLNPGAMEADYYVVNISLPIKIANVGCIIDKYGNVYYSVAINLLSASVGVPISTGEGWLLTKNRDTSQNFIGSITGLSACISAIGGVGGTLTLSLSSLGEGAAELDSSVSAGLAVGGAWTGHIGNVWEWLNE